MPGLPGSVQGTGGRGGWNPASRHPQPAGSPAILSLPRSTPSLSPSYTDDQRPFLCRKQKPKLFVGFFLCRLLNPQLCQPPILAPGWKPSLHLSYCFKPKFTVSVGGQDPALHPAPLHSTPLGGPWDSVEAGGSAHLSSAPPAWGEARGRGGEALVPLGSRHPCPNPGLLPPSRTKSPIELGVWVPAERLEKPRLHRPPMGDPDLRPRTGCAGCS